jgi:hypothetical protein
MNQRKIIHSQRYETPNGEGSTALPVSLNLYPDPKGNKDLCHITIREKSENWGVGRAK